MVLSWETQFFWDVTLWRCLINYRRFGWSSWLHLQWHSATTEQVWIFSQTAVWTSDLSFVFFFNLIDCVRSDDRPIWIGFRIGRLGDTAWSVKFLLISGNRRWNYKYVHTYVYCICTWDFVVQATERERCNKADSQCTFDVTLRRFHATIVAVERQQALRIVSVCL